jgi:hypothetical protein
MWRWVLVAALIAPLSAQAQGPAAAHAFAQRLYDAYQGGEPDHLGREAERTFAPSLLALIRRDQATAPPGEVGILDGDPICDCQDHGGVRTTRLVVRPAGPGRARAEVTLRFPTESRMMNLDLVATRGRWRVADVHTASTPSLVRLLEDGLDRRSADAR